MHRGISLLGFRVFYHHKLPRRSNLTKFEKKLKQLYSYYNQGLIGYDQIYDFLEGWCAYAKNADTYKRRKRVLKRVEEKFDGVSTKEVNRQLKCPGG